jgi:hypothetical protein
LGQLTLFIDRDAALSPLMEFEQDGDKLSSPFRG